MGTSSILYKTRPYLVWVAAKTPGAEKARKPPAHFGHVTMYEWCRKYEITSNRTVAMRRHRIGLGIKQEQATQKQQNSTLRCPSLRAGSTLGVIFSGIKKIMCLNWQKYHASYMVSTRASYIWLQISFFLWFQTHCKKSFFSCLF